MFKFREKCLCFKIQIQANSLQNITNHVFQASKKPIKKRDEKSIFHSRLLHVYISKHRATLQSVRLALLSSRYPIDWSTFHYTLARKRKLMATFFCLLFILCLLAVLVVAVLFVLQRFVLINW